MLKTFILKACKSFRRRVEIKIEKEQKKKKENGGHIE